MLTRVFRKIWPQCSPFATGVRGFDGLIPLKQSSKPPKLKCETLQVSGIFVKFECQAPLHERKAPGHKRKVLLTTFWRRFCHSVLNKNINFAQRSIVSSTKQ